MAIGRGVEESAIVVVAGLIIYKVLVNIERKWGLANMVVS